MLKSTSRAKVYVFRTRVHGIGVTLPCAAGRKCRTVERKPPSGPNRVNSSTIILYYVVFQLVYMLYFIVCIVLFYAVLRILLSFILMPHFDVRVLFKCSGLIYLI